MTEHGWLRRRWLAAGAAAVLLAGAGFGWWWRSVHGPAELPASACWSVLTRADLEPLAEGEHGTFGEHGRLAYTGSLRPTVDHQGCEVGRNTGAPIVNINLWLMDEFSMNAVFGAGAKSESRLDFGTDVRGWVEQGGTDVGLRCDNPENTRLGTPYVGIQVWTSVQRQSDATHRAVLGIALKYAKAVVAEFPCSNPVRLPESVPESAGNFPSPNH